MNPFLSFSDYSKLLLESYNLLFCSPRSETPTGHIPKSLLYYIDEDVPEFINHAKCLELDEDKGIILYDRGELITACKAYWGFRATGHDDVRILLGGLKACEDSGVDLDSGAPPQVSETEPYLPFNNAVIISFQDFVKKESYYQQIICAERINFDILDARGNIISESQLIKNLEAAEITYQSNKATIVHGKYAVIVGILLKYLGQRSVSVVLDNTEGFVSAKKSRKTSKSKSDDFDPASVPNSRSLPFVDPGKASKPKQVVEEQSRNICSCFIF
jgi:Rhodanese-like domain